MNKCGGSTDRTSSEPGPDHFCLNLNQGSRFENIGPITRWNRTMTALHGGRPQQSRLGQLLRRPSDVPISPSGRPFGLKLWESSPDCYWTVMMYQVAAHLF